MPSTSPTAHAGLGPHPSILGGGGRSFNPNEPSQRERQKQQDIDSAIGFSQSCSSSCSKASIELVSRAWRFGLCNNGQLS